MGGDGSGGAREWRIHAPGESQAPSGTYTNTRHAWGGPHPGQSLIRERRGVELEEMGKEEEEEEEEKKKKKKNGPLGTQ